MAESEPPPRQLPPDSTCFRVHIGAEVSRPTSWDLNYLIKSTRGRCADVAAKSGGIRRKVKRSRNVTTRPSSELMAFSAPFACVIPQNPPTQLINSGGGLQIRKPNGVGKRLKMRKLWRGPKSIGPPSVACFRVVV